MSDAETVNKGQESTVKPTKPRHRWTEDEDVRLLTQYRTSAESFAGKESDMWPDIYQKLLSVGIKVSSARSAKDRCADLLKDYKAKNRLDEWKSGDPGTFTEKEKLLCEILEFLDDRAKQGGPRASKKIAEQDKQARKDKKFITAATFSRKKRGLSGREKNLHDDLEDDGDLADEDPFVGSTPPKRERTSYNDAIKSFLEDSKQIKSKELKLQQDKLELERAREARLAEESKMKNDLGRERMAADKARMENDRKREETFANLMLEVLNTLKH